MADAVVVEEYLDKLYYADEEEEEEQLPRKSTPSGDVYEAARAGDVKRLKVLLERGVNVNARDQWDSVALYYACLAGHLDAAQMLLESGAVCSEHTYDGDRCHYAALNLGIRRLLKAFEARPPPLEPLPDALRSLFFRSGANSRYVDPTLGGTNAEDSCSQLDVIVDPDICFHIDGLPISAHRAVLAARCAFFRRKFENEWRDRKEVRFARGRLSFPAFFSLISFFYTDRLDIAVNDMDDLLKICRFCGCSSLGKLVERELVHQKFAVFKSLADIDESQRRFILQGSALPEKERLPADMERLLNECLEKSGDGRRLWNEVSTSGSTDFADLCFMVAGKSFRCHSSIISSRSDYVRARISRIDQVAESGCLQVLDENDFSSVAFEKLLRYIYTDVLDELDSDLAEEMLDISSKYLLFPLKRVVADVVLPRLENASPGELCLWLLVADMYGVWKLREYCLDTMAINFEVFASTPEFRYMLRKLPRPSGDESTRTTAPSAPGHQKQEQDNLLDDLRDKWLEVEAAELDKRDESARHFDRRLELLIEAAENDEFDTN